MFMETTQEIEKRFVEIATALNSHFPELDIVYNRDTTTSRATVINEENSAVITELDLSKSIEENLFEAIFSVKQMHMLFDA